MLLRKIHVVQLIGLQLLLRKRITKLINRVFLQKTIKNEVLTRENVFFAMPFIEGNMSVKDWTNDLIAKDCKNDPLEKSQQSL